MAVHRRDPRGEEHHRGASMTSKELDDSLRRIGTFHANLAIGIRDLKLALERIANDAEAIQKAADAARRELD